MLSKPFREAEILSAMERHLQVRFLFEDDIPARTSDEPVADLDASDLSLLPEVWRIAMHRAASIADSKAVLDWCPRSQTGTPH